jgi:hypothetical protein
LFQKAVTDYAINKTLENAQALAEAKSNLARYAWSGL